MKFITCFFKLTVLSIVILLCDKVNTFEPITTSVVAGVGYLLYWFKEPIGKATICKLKECCNDDYILGDFRSKFAFIHKHYITIVM